MNSRFQVKKVNNIKYLSHLSAKSRIFFMLKNENYYVMYDTCIIS